MVARAEPGHGHRQRLGVRRLRRDPLPRCPHHPALPAQHPPSAALRDDQQGRAGQPAAPIRGARLSLGAEAHASADADVPARVPPLRRADAGLPADQAPGGTAGVRAIAALAPAEAHRLGRAFQPRARCRLSAACQGCTASSPTKWTSACRWASASGHSLVLGTTRVGKTRLAELFVTQDIRRRNAAGEHEVVIVIDPKGMPIS